MSEVNFGELLNVQVETAERPKVFPEGTYDTLVTGHEMGTSSQKGTPFVKFQCKLIGPKEVEDELFEEAGGMEGLNKRKPLALTFYLTTDAMYRLREFLEDTLELSCSGRTFDVVIPEATNVSFISTIKHSPGSKPGDTYMNIDDTAVAV